MPKKINISRKLEKWRKVLYICFMEKMKTIKIHPKVHTELKAFVAVSGDNMETFSSQAILALLKDRGHKFIYPKQKETKK